MPPPNFWMRGRRFNQSRNEARMRIASVDRSIDSFDALVPTAAAMSVPNGRPIAARSEAIDGLMLFNASADRRLPISAAAVAAAPPPKVLCR